jgi:addiction module HigA family antidote
MFKNGMRPVHPGEILLEDYIKPMGVSVRAVAIALHVPYSRLSEITKGERGVSADTALRLERYFGSEAKGWLNLQAAYELRVAEIESGKTIAKEIKPLALVARSTPAGSPRLTAAGQKRSLIKRGSSHLLPEH